MNELEFQSKAQEIFSKYNIEVDQNVLDKLHLYMKNLLEWNKVMNLTAITDEEDIISKHFLDSIIINKYIEGNRGIDIGSGAGFPGIPLKIMFPEKKILLLDSLNKRIKFLNEVIDSLCLENVETVHSRAEDAAHNKLYREKFDLCVSRAVANLSTLSEYCLPFVRKNGYFVSYKSVELTNEAVSAENALKILGGSKPECIYFDLDDYDYHRSFAIIHKLDNTKKKYPRKAGTPSKEPL